MLLALLAVHVDLHVAGALPDRRGPALGRGGEPLERLAAVHDRLGDDERVGIEPLVVLERLLLRVRDRRLERLGDLLGRELLVELEDRVRLVHVLAANEAYAILKFNKKLAAKQIAK